MDKLTKQFLTLKKAYLRKQKHPNCERATQLYGKVCRQWCRYWEHETLEKEEADKLNISIIEDNLFSHYGR